MMEVPLPKGLEWASGLELGRETSALTARVWPNYLSQDSDIPEPGLKFEISRDELKRRFPVWGIRRVSTGELLAYANGVLLSIDLEQASLPEEGWQFAIQSAGSLAPRNCLCLLVANVDPTVRGFGLSQALIDRAKLATMDLGLSTMIAPVRPTLKHLSPYMPMTEYVSKRTETGEAYDPWIAMHVKSGGQLVNICHASVLVRATLSKWREWTGLPLLTAGDRPLPQGLVPLQVDIENGIGVYREPGIWFRYRFGSHLACRTS
jgi:hypothetical protein